MNVSDLAGLSAGRLQQVRPGNDFGQLADLGQPNRRPAIQGPSFSETLTDAVDSVDAAQKMADSQTAAFAAGEQENLHEVMIAMNQAELSLQLMTEVRNKMLDTYQELMRMQV